MSDTEKETSSHDGAIPALLLEDENNESGNTLYKYRDFSNMPEEEDPEEENANNQRGNLESSIRVQKFPVKLYAILAQKEFHDIIAWMPHGRSWKVLKPNLFESMVMPLFFEYSNYHSFNRLVNAWSFRRISSGPDRGSYYHELFLRGKPHLQKYMRRLPKTHKKLPMKKDDEPDFYKMDKECALPPLEEIPLSNTKMQNGMRGQPLAFSPVPQGQGLQRPNVGHPGRMFPEGVASQESFDAQDGGFMGVRGQCRSPTAMGGNGIPGMRDPTNFKNMEFIPATMDPMGAGFGGSMGSQMMGSHPMSAQMMGTQMASQMMGQMMPGQMGGQMMPGQMGGQMMPGQMASQMMPGQMGGQMMSSQMMGSQMMGSQIMGGQMMSPQMMSQQMGSQMGSSPMGGGQMTGQGGNFQNLQRLRQYQQMQLFERQMNPVPAGGGGEEAFGRMGASRPYC